MIFPVSPLYYFGKNTSFHFFLSSSLANKFSGNDFEGKTSKCLKSQIRLYPY